MKIITSSVGNTAFNCPHCEVLTTQTWYSLRASELDRDSPLPLLFGPGYHTRPQFDDVEDLDEKQRLHDMFDRVVAGRPTLDYTDQFNRYGIGVFNLFVSKCFNCDECSIWIHDNLVYPRMGKVPLANIDLSDDIRNDYNEAGSILDLSPRGAAALLRLAIQKLCKELGKSGENLNEDIGELVSDGLATKVQMSLDIVRVIGNNAVHPGKLDFDDRSTALSLFTLLNLIADQMISQPRSVEEAYNNLPPEALNSIKRRDE